MEHRRRSVRRAPSPTARSSCRRRRRRAPHAAARHAAAQGAAGAQASAPPLEAADSPAAASIRWSPPPTPLLDARPAACARLAQHPDPAGAARRAGARRPRLRGARDARRRAARSRCIAARYVLCTLLDEIGRRHAVGRLGRVGDAEPAGHVPQRDVGRREVLPADGQAGREPDGQPRPARADLRRPRARLRGPLPRARQRPRAARAAARAARADPAGSSAATTSATLSPHWQGSGQARAAAAAGCRLGDARARRRWLLPALYLALVVRARTAGPTRCSRRSRRCASAAQRRSPPRRRHRCRRRGRGWRRSSQPEIQRGPVSVRDDGRPQRRHHARRRPLRAGQRHRVGVECVPLIARIGEALNAVPGAMVVTGHTDNQPIRSVRFPSNWHLSQERAAAVQALLAARVQPDALTAEGRADREPVAANRRRPTARATAASRSPSTWHSARLSAHRAHEEAPRPALQSAAGRRGGAGRARPDRLVRRPAARRRHVPPARIRGRALGRHRRDRCCCGSDARPGAWLKARRRSAQLAGGLAAAAAPARPAPPTASEAEVAALDERFRDAIAALRQVRPSAAGRRPGAGDLLWLSGRQYLYELPWYVFIGAPGSGKTTALRQLRPEVSARRAPRRRRRRAASAARATATGGSPTRRCCSTPPAATPRRTVDREADARRLERLSGAAEASRARAARSTACIVTVSVADLLQQPAAEREAHAAAVRARLQELHEQLGIRFPIYVLVTKGDLLAGFTEFFGDTGQGGARAGWGSTLRAGTTTPGRRRWPTSHASSTRCEQRLHDRVLERMQDERDLAAARADLRLPAAVRRARRRCSTTSSSRSSRPRSYEQAAAAARRLLHQRHAGRHADRPRDGRARALARARAQAAAAGSGERPQLLPHHAAARGDLRRAGPGRHQPRAGAPPQPAALGHGRPRRRAAGRRGVARGWSATRATRPTSTTCARGWRRCSSRCARCRRRRRAAPTRRRCCRCCARCAISPTRSALASGRAVVDGLRAVPGRQARRRRRAGLPPAAARRAAAAPRAAHRGAAARRRHRQPRVAYEALKAYLMLHDPAHFDAEALKAWIGLDWERTLPRDAHRRAARASSTPIWRRCSRAARWSPRCPPTSALVAERARDARALSVRRSASTAGSSARASARELPEFTVARAAGPAAPHRLHACLRRSRSPGASPGSSPTTAITRPSSRRPRRVTAQLAAEEAWVLGTPSAGADAAGAVDAARLTDGVRRLYLHRLRAHCGRSSSPTSGSCGRRAWRRAIEIARVLSAPDTPLLPLLRAIVARDHARPEAGSREDAGRQGRRRRSGARRASCASCSADRRRRAAGAPPRPRRSSRASSTTASTALRRHGVAPRPASQRRSTRRWRCINEVYTHARRDRRPRVKGKAAPPPSDVPNKVKAEAARLPEPLRVDAADDLCGRHARRWSSASRETLSEAVGASVGDFCRQAIAGRYPFVRSSPRDVHARRLRARSSRPAACSTTSSRRTWPTDVDTSTRPWSFRQRRRGRRSATPAAWCSSSAPQAIRDVFFRGGGGAPALRLDVQAGRDGRRDHAVHPRRRRPDREVRPRAAGAADASSGRARAAARRCACRCTPPAAATALRACYSKGPWALFRLFDSAQSSRPAQPERFARTFNLDGRASAEFEIIAGSVQNPFRLRRARSSSRCPAQAFVTRPARHRAGWYGKLPCLGDFASRRLPPDFIARWDGWLQRCDRDQRAQLGERGSTPTSPARCGASHGPSAWRRFRAATTRALCAALLMPSVDRVGRYFPLTSPPVARPAARRRLQAMLDLAATALEDLALRRSTTGQRRQSRARAARRPRAAAARGHLCAAAAPLPAMRVARRRVERLRLPSVDDRRWRSRSRAGSACARRSARVARGWRAGAGMAFGCRQRRAAVRLPRPARPSVSRDAARHRGAAEHSP